MECTPGNHFFTAKGRLGTIIWRQKESINEARATALIAILGKTPTLRVIGNSFFIKKSLRRNGVFTAGIRCLVC